MRMMHRSFYILAALLTASHVRANVLDGVWTGSYFCQQGLTALELFVTISPNGVPLALFHFGDGSIDRPEGCFAMQGTLSKERMNFTAGKWLLRPYGYVSVDLSGIVNGNAYAGQVVAPIAPPSPCNGGRAALLQPRARLGRHLSPSSPTHFA